ncbi:Restriction endonuclease BglII [mine drainage metagenome]|uniref:Restriction endonuclease BglII n=2 Tax=mine drainage metagenome TaxID=410659 RepID=T1CBJ9_9ZZZZ
MKGSVAFNLEWNSKDQTFDRDLYAFRTFHEAGVISAAVLLTRSEALREMLPFGPCVGIPRRGVGNG